MNKYLYNYLQIVKIYYSTFVKQIYLISETGGNKMEGREAEVAKRSENLRSGIMTIAESFAIWLVFPRNGKMPTAKTLKV